MLKTQTNTIWDFRACEPGLVLWKTVKPRLATVHIDLIYNHGWILLGVAFAVALVYWCTILKFLIRIHDISFYPLKHRWINNLSSQSFYGTMVYLGQRACLKFSQMLIQSWWHNKTSFCKSKEVNGQENHLQSEFVLWGERFLMSYNPCPDKILAEQKWGNRRKADWKVRNIKYIRRNFKVQNKYPNYN